MSDISEHSLPALINRLEEIGVWATIQNQRSGSPEYDVDRRLLSRYLAAIHRHLERVRVQSLDMERLARMLASFFPSSKKLGSWDMNDVLGCVQGELRRVSQVGTDFNGGRLDYITSAFRYALESGAIPLSEEYLVDINDAILPLWQFSQAAMRRMRRSPIR